MSITSVSSLNASQPALPVSVAAVPGRRCRASTGTGNQLRRFGRCAAGLQRAKRLWSKQLWALFRPRNSANQFAAVGQALQAGDLAAAKQAADKLGKNLLNRTSKSQSRTSIPGAGQGAQKAISHLEGDFWAVTGQNFSNPRPERHRTDQQYSARTRDQCKSLTQQGWDVNSRGCCRPRGSSPFVISAGNHTPGY